VINVATTGKYRVELDYSDDPGSANNIVTLTCGSEKLEIHPRATSNWTSYRLVKVGEINLNQSGHVDVTLKCTKKSGPAVMNVRQITFVPADNPSQAEDMVPVISNTVGGVMTLTPIMAEVIGTSVTIEGDGNFGSWTSNDTYFRWPIQVDKAGKYELSWLYSLDPSNDGTQIQVTVGSAPTLTINPATTSDWTDYHEVKIGDVTIDKPGKMDVTVKATQLGASFVMNLKKITLSPVSPHP
jgi:hypothetical protein